LKLLLRRFDAESFTLVAADTLGQSRWEIRRAGDRAVWIDPSARQFCRLDPQLPLAARLSLPSIPVGDIPGLLTGGWPAPEVVRTSAEGIAAAPGIDDGDRPFTGERAANDPAGWANWTLWQGGEPIAWFKRLGQDSLLSVRRPAVQVRWRVTASGAIEPAPERSGEPERDPEARADGSWPDGLPVGAQEMACPDNAIP
jgi:hypothetical protein